MIQSTEQALKLLAEGKSLLGPGWTAVDSFDDLSDDDEYEEEVEEIYVTVDLGTGTDNKVLSSESRYQLIGLDTPLPFLKLGNQVFQGQVTPLVGTDVILGLVRNPDDPQNPSHPPIHATSHRLTFQAVTLDNIDNPDSDDENVGNKDKKKGGEVVLSRPFLVDPAASGSRHTAKQREKLSPSKETQGNGAVGLGIGQDETGDEDNGHAMEVDGREETGNGSVPDDLHARDNVIVGNTALADSTGMINKIATAESTDVANPGDDAVPTLSSNAEAGPSNTRSDSVEAENQKKRGRPKGSANKPTIMISDPSQLAELVDLERNTDDLRLQFDAGTELYAAVSGAVSRPKHIKKLTKAQEERLMLGLPLTGPGSRGGTGSRSRNKAEAEARQGNEVAKGLHAGVGPDSGQGRSKGKGKGKGKALEEEDVVGIEGLIGGRGDGGGRKQEQDIPAQVEGGGGDGDGGGGGEEAGSRMEGRDIVTGNHDGVVDHIGSGADVVMEDDVETPTIDKIQKEHTESERMEGVE